MLRTIIYELKKFYRNKDGALFGILFPLGFALIYIFAFSNLTAVDKTFEPVPVATVIESGSDQVLPLLANLGQEGQLKDGQIIKTKSTESDRPQLMTYLLVNQDEAIDLLDQQIVSHQLTMSMTNQEVTAKLDFLPGASDDVQTNIIYNALVSMTGIHRVISQKFAKQGLNFAQLALIQDVLNNETNPKSVTQTQNTKGTSGHSILFYACLGYICIYFMTTGSQLIYYNEANHSSQALRLQMAPLSKRKRIFLSFIPLSLLSISLAYLAFAMFIVAKVPLGNRYWQILLLLTVGVLVGILLGMVLTTWLNLSQEKMTGLLAGLGILLGAFSGLMTPPLSKWVYDNINWVNTLNPVALVSDGIYYLNNYPTDQQYWMNVSLLVFMMLILAGLVYLKSGGDSYETL